MVHKGDVGLVVLTIALLLEEVVVVAPGRFRESPAGRRTIFVDCASSLRRVKELARALEDSVVFMTKHTAVTLFHFCEALFGEGIADSVVLSEAGNISTRHDDQVI